MKGSTSLAFIVLIASLWGVGFFGIIFSTGDIEDTVNYQTGDFNTIAESKLKADTYESRIQVELNYSTNIRALEMGSQGGEDEEDGNENDLGWPESIPSYEDDLKPEYLDAVAEHLRTQNNVIGCTNPQIKNADTYDTGKTKFEANLEEPWIRCNDDSTEATVNISDTLQTSNPKNKYLVLANYSEVFAKKAKDLINGKSESYWTAEGYGSDCGSSGAAISDAEDMAKSFLPEENFAKNSYEHDELEDKPEYFERTDLETEHKKVIVSRDADSDGDCGEDGEKTYYEADATAEISEITMDFAYKDKENEVIYKDGSMKNINFSFTYKVNP